MTTGQAAPWSASKAAHIIASASTEPTERSMPAVTMTMNWPRASSCVEGRLSEDVEEVALGQEDVRLGQPGEDAP